MKQSTSASAILLLSLLFGGGGRGAGAGAVADTGADSTVVAGTDSGADAGGRGMGKIGVPAAGSYYHCVFPGRPPAGIGEEDDIEPANVDAYEAAAGRKVAWVHFFHNGYVDRPILP